MQLRLKATTISSALTVSLTWCRRLLWRFRVELLTGPRLGLSSQQVMPLERPVRRPSSGLTSSCIWFLIQPKRVRSRTRSSRPRHLVRRLLMRGQNLVQAGRSSGLILLLVRRRPTTPTPLRNCTTAPVLDLRRMRPSLPSRTARACSSTTGRSTASRPAHWIT